MVIDRSKTKRRWTRSCHAQEVGRSTISTNVVLVRTELAAFGSDSLQILLSRSVGITNLKKKTLVTNGLTMKLLDDLFADLARFEAVVD